MTRPQTSTRRITALALALPILASCSAPAPTAATASPSTLTTPAASAAAGPMGEERLVTFDGRDRGWVVYASTSLDRAKPSPLVIYLHGSGGSMRGVEAQTGLSVRAESQRFVVVYPQGIGGTWNFGCCTLSYNDKLDDVGFLRRVIDATMAERSIDPDRIYLAGFSAGAAMAYRIACEQPERIAAVVAIAGAVLTESCAPRADLSILEIHGMADNLFIYGGCSPTTVPCGYRSATLPPVETMVARFREIYACPKPVVQRDGVLTTTRATPCRGGTEVTLIAVEGGSHPSPIGSVTNGSWATADIPVALKFLLAQRRPPSR
jgi:polyhydroxybutyrate depolymerase